MSDNKPKRPVSEEQLVAIARLAQMKGDNAPRCDHQQAKDCEYCPCSVKEFMAAIDEVLQ
jgi:hypothetical protein